MIDLFGLGRSREEKETPPEGAAPRAPEPAPEPDDKAPRGAPGLWLFLLVLDVLFVAVFGGVVAAKVMQYWKAPAPAIARRRRPSRRAPAPKPAPPPAAKPAPAKPAAAAKPAKKKKKRAEAKRTPLPSLAKTPAAHAAPKPSAAPGSPAVVHARPVVFRLRAPHARDVQLIGAFIVHGGRMPMKKGKRGEWSLKIYLNPGQYRYLFLEDGRKILDPENPRTQRGASSLNVP